ncbi:MAG: GNAT family N-acetyltransferase [Candidatus Planktophila sp.]|nr:GNAT family N-acetyltransferase [Candidatus Planktophila sp.]
MAQELNTTRLRLRNWQVEDLPRWIEMNSDPVTLKYFVRTDTKEESEISFERNKIFLELHEFGLWAVEEKESENFMGFIGLSDRSLEGISFTPCIEIGWRLDKAFWGRGYATEGAREVLKFAQENLKIDQIYSYTARINTPSINVMKKIGLIARPELDFDHPKISAGLPIRNHVVFST